MKKSRDKILQFERTPSRASRQETTFFRVSGPELWGDYGHILFNGMTGHLDRRRGKLQLERAGPFMPPITFPAYNDVVVTDEFRRALEASPFAGLKFKSVIKTRIVDLPWNTWDRTAKEPPLMEEIGEPEDYVLNFTHSPETADRLVGQRQIMARCCG